MSAQPGTGSEQLPRLSRLPAPLGAEVLDVDLAAPLGDQAFARIAAAFNEHSLLLFRDQQLTPAQQVAFSRRFGELEHHLFSHWCLPDQPEVLIVSNVRRDGEPVGVYNAGRYWHTDLSYMQAPSRGSLLYALEVPHDADGRPLGDTWFADAAAAYDALDDAMKARIESLEAEFSLAHQRQKLLDEGDGGAALTDEQRARAPTVVRRIVQTHPLTGRRVLFVNEGHTQRLLGLPEAEASALLAELCAHVTRDEFVYRHSWRVGDVLMWDNYPTQHLAHFDYALPQRRLMHRTTLVGQPFL